MNVIKRRSVTNAAAYALRQMDDRREVWNSDVGYISDRKSDIKESLNWQGLSNKGSSYVKYTLFYTTISITFEIH